MSDSQHIEPQKYAGSLRTGTNSREDDEHVAVCDLCRREVEKYVALNKQQWQTDVFGILLHFTTEIARSTFALVLPPLKKHLNKKDQKKKQLRRNCR